MMADMLSQITTCLSPEAIQSILDRVTLGATCRIDGYDSAMVEGGIGLGNKYVSPQDVCW